MTWPVVDGLRALELGSRGRMRAWLNGLVLDGQKQATTGPLAEYDEGHEPLESVGERLALVDDDGKGVGVIEVTRVDIVPFGQVPWEFAQAEGEGEESIDSWRKSHLDFFAAAGVELLPETPMVLLWFRLANVDG